MSRGPLLRTSLGSARPGRVRFDRLLKSPLSSGESPDGDHQNDRCEYQTEYQNRHRKTPRVSYSTEFKSGTGSG